MRTASTAFLAALVVMALFWGNCLSCPQMQLADSHRCCPKGKQPGSECRTQVLQHFVKADPQKVESPAPAMGEIAVAAVPAPVVVWTDAARPLTDGHAPPDRLASLSSFRI